MSPPKARKHFRPSAERAHPKQTGKGPFPLPSISLTTAAVCGLHGLDRAFCCLPIGSAFMRSFNYSRTAPTAACAAGPALTPPRRTDGRVRCQQGFPGVVLTDHMPTQLQGLATAVGRRAGRAEAESSPPRPKPTTHAPFHGRLGKWRGSVSEVSSLFFFLPVWAPFGP